jgi:hypothetical protein
MRHFASSVVVVSSVHAGQIGGTIATATCSVCAEPPWIRIVVFCPRSGRVTGDCCSLRRGRDCLQMAFCAGGASCASATRVAKRSAVTLVMLHDVMGEPEQRRSVAAKLEPGDPERRWDVVGSAQERFPGRPVRSNRGPIALSSW